MQAERWKQIEHLYHAALAQPPEKRAEFIEQACPGDPQLGAEVESLLNDAGERTSFFEGLVAFGSSEGAAGAVVGSYCLVEPIGHGGMGEVWLAEQKQPVRRRVAVKLIRAGMDTREVVARFESERQALALMDHPNIAKVFEAGATPQGRPYFVMEYVTGMPITDYCDKHKLTTRQRLELLVRVCEGVQHAHQKAIIHRDLKPSNILVGEVDGKPAPRIIDFGVAKATGQRLTSVTTFTRAGAIVGTPGYMSPEQADSAGADVDTRTDVYSLGVVLYELLVGALPLDLSTTPPDQILSRLREEDAPRPSTRLSMLGDRTGITTQNRGADGPSLMRQLRGDLDAIALKALEKDRSRRYATPSDLSSDIGRYFRHQPVLARRAGAGYRARKYIRRHRLGAAVAATAAVLLLSAAVAQTFALRRIRRERDRADRVTQFMTGMFKVSDPSEARGNDIRAREILDTASKNIQAGLAKDPELQAQMMHVMGRVYKGLGLYARADSLLAHAVEIRRRTLGANNPDTLKSMYELAETLNGESRYREAEKLSRDAMDTRRRVLGPEHRDTLNSMSQLAMILNNEGRYPEADKQIRNVLEVVRRVSGPQDPLSVTAKKRLAGNLMEEGKNSEAEKLYREVLEAQRHTLGSDHPDVLADMSNLLLMLPSGAEKERLYRDTCQAFRRVLGPEHHKTLLCTFNLALFLGGEKRYAEAERLYRETLEIARKALGPEHRVTLYYTKSLAFMLMNESRFSEAGQLLRPTFEAQRRTLGPEHPDTLDTLGVLGELAAKEKRYPEAEKYFREGLEGRRHILGPGHPLAAAAAYDLAMVQALEGKRDEAFANLQWALENGLGSEGLQALEKEPDLKPLHGDSRFDALVTSARQRAATVPKSK